MLGASSAFRRAIAVPGLGRRNLAGLRLVLNLVFASAIGAHELRSNITEPPSSPRSLLSTDLYPISKKDSRAILRIALLYV